MKLPLSPLLLYILSSILYIHTISAEGLYTSIYKVLDAQGCVLLLDKSGPIGCNAPQGGVNGDLHFILTDSELTSFLKDPPSDPKAVVIYSSMLNKEVLNKLHSTNKLKGVLLLYSPPSNSGWSPDISKPNEKWGLPIQIPWNAQGDGLNFESIPFPIYALSEDESSRTLSLQTNDTSYPRHAVQFHTFMHATVDAKTCLRRSQCMPLGGKSVWSSFNTVGDKPIIMAMANIDSTALIHDLAVGADSTASGIVGLVGAAMALQKVNKADFTSDVVFAFWAGESWGYLGSSKFLRDIQTFDCVDKSGNSCKKPYKPDLSFMRIKLSNINYAIELNQIGLTKTPPSLWVHQQNHAADSLSTLLQTVSENTNLSIKAASNTASGGIPPSSLMSFLKQNASLSGVVVSDHELDYVNRNYHSHMDTGAFNQISNSSLCEAATNLARTLYLLGTGQSEPNDVSNAIQAPCALLANLTYCLTSNFNCDLISNFIDGPRPVIPTYYTGVFGYSIDGAYASAPAVLLYNLMAAITAVNQTFNFDNFTFNNATKSNCDCGSNQTCVAGVCIYSETHYHDAISLGIDWDYSNYKWIVVNESEPLWVESNWDSIGVELFRRANPSTEALFLAFGIVEFIISFIAVFYAKRYFLRNFKIF